LLINIYAGSPYKYTIFELFDVDVISRFLRFPVARRGRCNSGISSGLA